jgi:hypothetical protein
MKGFVLSEQGHVVNVLAPVDITGGVTGQRFSMANYQHASIIFQIGVSAAAFTKIFLKQCTSSGGAGATAIPFSIYKQETAGASNDVLGARTAVTSAGYTPAATDGIFYVIELDANELADGSPWVELSATNGSNSVIASAVAVLSGARYAEAQSPTITA